MFFKISNQFYDNVLFACLKIVQIIKNYLFSEPFFVIIIIEMKVLEMEELIGGLP